MTYPEHEKLKKVQELTQTISEFLDWVTEHYQVELGRPTQKLLAEWAGIDLDKLEAEKREMLAVLRKANGR